MEKIEAVFIDDGGVMQNNQVRGQQWLEFLPEYLMPVYGGQKEQWAAANKEVLRRQMPLFTEGTGFPDIGGFVETRQALAIESVKVMFEHVGIRPPATEAECLSLYQSYTSYVVEKVRAELPGAIDAIRGLSASGYRLYTASGTESAQLGLMLDVLGVRNLFVETYGPDLVDTHKGSKHYYRLLLEHSGEPAASSAFIDDSRKCVEWAMQGGAAAVLITEAEAGANDTFRAARDLASVPDLLATMSPRSQVSGH